MLTLNPAAGTALSLNSVGGAIGFVGGTLNDNGALIEAPAGNVSLEAKTGDLDINSGSLVSSAGVSKQFFDVIEYAPAGNITLTADRGGINVQSGATLDFSSAADSNGNLIGGAAGSLTLSAPQSVVTLNGKLIGGAASGYLGGSFSLNNRWRGSISTTSRLSSPQVASTMRSRCRQKAGDLILSAGNTLTAHVVSLTADADAATSTSTNTIGTGTQSFIVQTGLSSLSAGEVITLADRAASGESMTGTITSYNPATGALVVNVTSTSGSGTHSSWTTGGNVVIAGTINASGQAGGEIDLYGKSFIDLEGSLIATGSSATQLGGTVKIGTTARLRSQRHRPGDSAANPYNATYGYENFYTSGVIRLGANALIDVSGGSASGLSGGTVNFRAPLLAAGATNANGDQNTNGDVNVFLPAAFAANRGIVGSRATTLEAYAVWSTTDATTGAQHFDGIVDPAGWYGDSVIGAGQPGHGTWHLDRPKRQSASQPNRQPTHVLLAKRLLHADHRQRRSPGLLRLSERRHDRRHADGLRRKLPDRAGRHKSLHQWPASRA